MRIIAGRAKGLKLAAPAGLEVRPTADRVKESVFNILSTRLMEARVLDLFSGSGNLGLEAWSRGAAEVICVDNDAASLNFIRKNLDKAKAGSQIKIYRSEAAKSIASLYAKKKEFDIIFCDPPYNRGWCDIILKQLKKYNILQKDGILVLEHSKQEEISLPEGMSLLREEKYGETLVAFFTVEQLFL